MENIDAVFFRGKRQTQILERGTTITPELPDHLGPYLSPKDAGVWSFLFSGVLITIINLIMWLFSGHTMKFPVSTLIGLWLIAWPILFFAKPVFHLARWITKPLHPYIIPLIEKWIYPLIKKWRPMIPMWVPDFMTRWIPDVPAPVQSGRPLGGFGLWVGDSTGTMASLGHGTGIKAGQNVILQLEDACQNVCVLGGIGAGKTTRAIQPLLVQLLDQDAGGLIFDIKGDFKKAVLELARQTGREVVTIGPGHRGINLLAGLTPEMASSFLKSAYLLTSGFHQDPFWVDTATDLAKSSLGMLAYLPEHYSLSGLYSFIFREDFNSAIRNELSARLDQLNDRDLRIFNQYFTYYNDIFLKFDDKVVSGVRATASQALSQFNHPDLVDHFCTEGPENVDLRDVVNGKIFLVDLPLSTWGLSAKVIYTFIKLRFFNVMQRRNLEPDWNKTRPVFFMCDEYQEIISANKDGLSDLNFWDKSRSSKCVGIISGQSVSSFYAAIGNKELANALLQNFRQKLCFRTEDQETLTALCSLSGKVDRAKIGKSSGASHGQSGGSSSSGESLSWHQEQVLDPQVIRGLGPDRVVAFLSIEGQSWDDVLSVVPVYV